MLVGALLLAMLPSAYAVEPRLQASYITCRPGPEVYELVGHEALRIRGIDEKGEVVDTVWNYGVFDFAAPNFIGRFVKGETDYIVYPSPTDFFLGSYAQRGSGVVEQDLNLTPEETIKLRKLLQINSLPANRTYRYNYLRDNCATRVAAMVDSSLNRRMIIYPDTTSYASYREAMRDFHRNYPWYQFGIDLVLGGELDNPLQSREELFAPALMEQKASIARFSDGSPLVKSSRILVAGNPAGEALPDGTYSSALGPTPWWMSPLAVFWAVCAVSAVIALIQWRKRKLLKLYNSLFFGILGLAGCVVWYLVFFSTHAATSPNLLALWVNPLQLVLAIFIWWRHTRPVAFAMSVVDIIVTLLLALAWPMQRQQANPAIFPLWLATFLLALSFAAIWNKLSVRKPVRKYADKRTDMSQFGHLPHKSTTGRKSAGNKKNTSRNSSKRKK